MVVPHLRLYVVLWLCLAAFRFESILTGHVLCAWQCSDSTAYVHSSIPEEDDDTFGGPQTLYQFNPYSGAQTGEVALKPLFGTPQIGSLAC